jgi:hypothetical protein
MHGVRDFCLVFASFVCAGHEPFMSHYYRLKGATRSQFLEGGVALLALSAETSHWRFL